MVEKLQKFALLVRVGYAARGIVYVLLGYLALTAAGETSGGQNASFDFLQGVPLGSPVLYVTAVGLAAYALYKLIAAIGDLEHKGFDAKAIVERVGYGASGCAHTVLAWSAFQFAHGEKQSASADSGSSAASTLLAWDMGAIVLGVVGLGFVTTAVVQCRTVITASFMRTVGAGAPTSVCWIGRIGHAARAVVFLVIGWSLIHSAWLGNGAEAKGLGTALVSLRENQALHTIVALGLLMFGVFSLIVARFRIIPDVEKKDLKPKLK
ncbi:DUF1206 domain-containing protein [Novosphingobium sp. JCM 18896]|uniref:DUF1206 domain-containing protein n=1 Tax=Novosphingobium sp. JCM 18896 TaxID=2989731 RepID=UPI0022223D32|nr:DUF1206 domain-containing protein [Novosphingobium sp. JCM 18896]MCW1432258.1 DUF1206 domain-containing protein [Novosphingobium sp. JCM 18896]